MLDFLYSGITILLFAIILMAGFKKSNNDITPSVIIQRYNNLRGIFALQIVVGHVIRYENTLLYPLGKAMIISVGFFFFVSSFGMVQSYKNKKNYLDGFLLSKCGYLLILAGAAYVFDSAVSLLIYGKGIRFSSLQSFISGFFKGTNWYIWELLVFYIMFYIFYKYIKKYRCLIFFAITTIAITFLFESGWIEGYYASALAFPFGMLVGEYFEDFFAFIFGLKGKMVTVILSVLGVCSLLLGEDSLIGMVYLRNMICIAGLLILMYIFRYFEFNNMILRILGKYSTEIYLFQFTWLLVSLHEGYDYKIRIPFVIVTTGITAFLMHFVLIPIQNMCKHIQTGGRK